MQIKLVLKRNGLYSLSFYEPCLKTGLNTCLIWLPMCGRQPLVALCPLQMRLQRQNLLWPQCLPACSSQPHFLRRFLFFILCLAGCLCGTSVNYYVISKLDLCSSLVKNEPARSTSSNSKKQKHFCCTNIDKTTIWRLRMKTLIWTLLYGFRTTCVFARCLL